MTSYSYKDVLVSPDFKVDIKDVARVSGAFGSFPGHERWIIVGDITCDTQIEIKDLARVSARFGWHP